jgi:hypothetical protein
VNLQQPRKMQSQLPAVSLFRSFWLLPLASLGLVLLAVANTGARAAVSWAEPLFWGSLLLLFVPLAAHLLLPGRSRNERVGTLLVLGLGFYLVRVLHHPTAPMFHDEFLHWRSTDTLLQFHTLFVPNPALPVGAHYPGIHALTAAVAQLGGVDIYTAATVVLGAARLVLVLALFLFFEQFSDEQVASVATLCYMVNPSFVFWSAQFGYESLALPLAIFALYGAARYTAFPPTNTIGVSLVVLASFAAVSISHHLSSFALAAFLSLWALTVPLCRSIGKVLRPLVSEQARPRWLARLLRPIMNAWSTTPATPQHWQFLGSTWLAVFSIVLIVAWITFVAFTVVNYAGPYFVRLGNVMHDIVQGSFVNRQLFSAGSGQVAPLWERLAGYAAALLTIAGVFGGLLLLFRARHYTNALVLALAAGAIGYLASHPMRFIPEIGVELAARAGPFLFVAVAYMLALTLHWFLRGLTAGIWRVLPALAVLVVMFVGNISIGWYPSERMPGPYQVVAQGRSIERQGEAAAHWTKEWLGRQQRIATDRINRLLQASYGRQHTVTNNELWIIPVFFEPQLGLEERAIIEEGRIEYLVVDRRLSSGIPMFGFYFNEVEPQAFNRSEPLPAEVLTKFDDIDQVDRIFDSGDIRIYDVRPLWREPDEQTAYP